SSPTNQSPPPTSAPPFSIIWASTMLRPMSMSSRSCPIVSAMALPSKTWVKPLSVSYRIIDAWCCDAGKLVHTLGGGAEAAGRSGVGQDYERDDVAFVLVLGLVLNHR